MPHEKTDIKMQPNVGMGSIINKNIILLFISQFIALTAVIGVINFAPLVGDMLGDNPALATLPITLTIAGTALSTGMMSLFMDRFGRRMGFRLGATFGLLGMMIAAAAIYVQSFILFCVGALVFGVFQGSTQYLRFAAAESVHADDAPKAISYVLIGSVFGALLWPVISNFFSSLEILGSSSFIGIFIYAGLATLLIQIPFAFMGSTHRYADEQDAQAKATAEGEANTELPDRTQVRPLGDILMQKALWVAVINGAFGYAMMSFVMTATPLAMKVCGFAPSVSSQVISLHVIGMYLPGLITGTLIQRFGILNVLTAGHLIFALAFIVSLMGIEEWHFTLALILLGVGWNFCFIGGSSLLTRTYTDHERGKVQAVNETAVVSFMALASLGAGFILTVFGWQTVNQIAFVMLLVAIILTNKYRRHVLATEKK